ncbi:hypothetical protein LINPERHAP2_LOCUS16217 [Linum perenne]
MDFFKCEVASITMSHVVYTNDHMRDASHRAIFNNFFLIRTIITPTVVDTTCFSRYNLHPDALIAALRWSHVITKQPTKIYLDVVYQFYTNLKLEGSLSAGKFSTFVDGHIIMVTPLLLAQISAFLERLGIPLKHRYSETHKEDYLRRIGWSHCVPICLAMAQGEGFNILEMDADVVDDLVTQEQLKLRVLCDYPEASDYERCPDHPF